MTEAKTHGLLKWKPYHTLSNCTNNFGGQSTETSTSKSQATENAVGKKRGFTILGDKSPHESMMPHLLWLGIHQRSMTQVCLVERIKSMT